jgi:predicted kinase
MSADVRVIVITGTMGSGKTTVLGEASDILTARGISHAAIDLDGLGVAYSPDTAMIDIAYLNLSSVWHNYAAAGMTRLLLAAAIETRDALGRVAAAVPGSSLVVCRLKAGLETMQRRVSVREPGMLRDSFVARVAELETILDEAALEEFSLVNDDRSVTDVATALLARAAWI